MTCTSTKFSNYRFSTTAAKQTVPGMHNRYETISCDGSTITLTASLKDSLRDMGNMGSISSTRLVV